MRMLANRSSTIGKPYQVKRSVSDIRHVAAPLKGLNLATKLSQAAPLTAPILDNWVLEEDKVSCRPGYRMIFEDAAKKPVRSIVPFYGTPVNMAAATNGTLTTPGGTVLHTGYLSDDWTWCSFANLGVATYTLMANGKDGVWSWDGRSLAAGLVKETITAGASMAWFNQNDIQIVITHQNRVWMADTKNLTVYYLPIQTKSGEVKQLPLSALFKRGGTVRAIYTWTIDGGAGMDDKLVIFSSNNECAIYAGNDPDSDFQLVGVFRFDSPMSKHCVTQYGGELYVLISTGLVPLSTLMRAESEQLGQSDKGVVSAFLPVATAFRNRFGWEVILDHSSGRLICNMPLGAPNRYRQMVRKMPTTYFTSWSAIPSTTWQWLDNQLYFGTDDGRIMQMDPVYLSDDGMPIKVDMQSAWGNFKTPAYKHFKMIKPYITTDGTPHAYVDIKVDFENTPPENQPDVTFSQVGAFWDTGTWDDDYWAQGELVINQWNGVAAAGNVAAPRLAAQILGCTFAVSGFDVLFEPGSIL